MDIDRRTEQECGSRVVAYVINFMEWARDKRIFRYTMNELDILIQEEKD